MGLFSSASDPRMAATLARIEAKLDLLLASMGVEAPPAPGVDDEVAALARAGQKIEAIKLYRERTGVGLAEAKAAVDAM